MNVLQMLVKILNAGIDYDLTCGNKTQAQAKIKARDRILDQMLAQKS